MTDGNNHGLLNLNLGPRSSFCGCHLNSESSSGHLSISVDFKKNIIKPYPSAQQVEDSRKDVLWDEKVIKLETGTDKYEELNRYSSNPKLHWSQLADIVDKNIVELEHCNNFETFHSGTNYFTEHSLSDEFEDKMRYQTEKCDIFRGFVNTYDSNTGYGGVMAKLLPLLDDLYGRKPKLTFAIGEKEPTIFEFESVVLNSVCSFLQYNFSDDSYRGVLNQDTPYHNSALHSLFLQQTLQITNGGKDFKDFTCYMSPLSRNILTSFMGVPYDTTEETCDLESLYTKKYLTNTIKPISQFTDQMSLPLHHTYMSSCGIPNISSHNQFFSALTQATTDSRVFSSTTKYSYDPAALPLDSTFPQFFNDKILSDGRLRSPHQMVRSDHVTRIPVVSVLQNTEQSAKIIKQVLKTKITVNKSSELLAAGVLDDDVKDIQQRLHELLDNYSL